MASLFVEFRSLFKEYLEKYKIYNKIVILFQIQESRASEDEYYFLPVLI